MGPYGGLGTPRHAVYLYVYGNLPKCLCVGC